MRSGHNRRMTPNPRILARLSPFAIALALAACASAGAPRPPAATDAAAHPAGIAALEVPAIRHPGDEPPAWWFRDGPAQAAALCAIPGRAKNGTLFVGAGSRLATVGPARILEGQRKGGSGEENRLSWETFPATAFSKTYNTDSQTPDSAGTMTAITTGVKSHMGSIGVYAGNRNDCADSLGKRALTWLELADGAGLGTGIVTTARVTHATPAATYAHVPNRGWENNAALPAEAAAQ